jgi:hypothetical protein
VVNAGLKIVRRVVSRQVSRRSSIASVLLLVAVILASPLTDTHPRTGALLAIVTLVSVLLGAVSEGNHKAFLIVGIPLVLAWCSARLMEVIGSERMLFIHVSHLLGLLLSCIIIWALLDRMRRTAQITSNVIAEAAIIYLVVAIAFSQFYWIINGLVPHCFSQVVTAGQSSTFMYLSMVTLTGLGAGALVPINPFVRILSGFESMTGLFYFALVVSRLVSSYTHGPKTEERK